jgi:hypothetical protein
VRFAIAGIYGLRSRQKSTKAMLVTDAVRCLKEKMAMSTNKLGALRD